MAEETLVVTKEVIEVHRRVGFHIRNWMSEYRAGAVRSKAGAGTIHAAGQ